MIASSTSLKLPRKTNVSGKLNWGTSVYALCRRDEFMQPPWHESHGHVAVYDDLESLLYSHTPVRRGRGLSPVEVQPESACADDEKGELGTSVSSKWTVLGR